MPSFDVVSKPNISELDNVVNGIAREVKQRYDLKRTDCSIVRTEKVLTINADDNICLLYTSDAADE